MINRPHRRLTPEEEIHARVANCKPVQARLRLGLPVVVGRADGTPVTVYPGEDTAEKMAAPEPVDTVPGP